MFHTILESSNNIFFVDYYRKNHFSKKNIILAPNMSIGCCSNHLHARPILTIFARIFDIFLKVLLENGENDITYSKIMMMYPQFFGKPAKNAKKLSKIEFFALSPHMAHFDYFLTKNQFQGGGKKIFHQKYTILPFYRSKKSQKMPKLQGFKVFPNFEKSTIF